MLNKYRFSEEESRSIANAINIMCGEKYTVISDIFGNGCVSKNNSFPQGYSYLGKAITARVIEFDDPDGITVYEIETILVDVKIVDGKLLSTRKVPYREAEYFPLW